jgi:deazaflavin-dependent oxidoreductase (nitroreductase family)
MKNAELKRRVAHALGKYLLNIPDKLRFAIGLALPGRALLETVGRKTGKPRRTPLGDGLVGNQFWIVAEHGMRADYVRNLAQNPRVRLKLRHEIRVRWHSGTGSVLPQGDPRGRQRWLAQKLPASRTNAAIVRLLGTELLTIRVDLET